MYIPLKTETGLTPEELEKQYFEKLRYDSHKFVEINQGIAGCQYCGLLVNGNAGVVYSNIQLCPKNPHLFNEKFFPILDIIIP